VSNAIDARAYLLMLEAHLRDKPQCPLPLHMRDWILRGIARHRLEGEDLARALGLRRVGHDSLATQERRARRDAALREAAALVDNDPAALAAAVRRFESRTWQRWNALPFVPAEASELNRKLFTAFQNGPVPGSTKQIKRILARTPNQFY